MVKLPICVWSLRLGMFPSIVQHGEALPLRTPFPRCPATLPDLTWRYVSASTTTLKKLICNSGCPPERQRSRTFLGVHPVPLCAIMVSRALALAGVEPNALHDHRDVRLYCTRVVSSSRNRLCRCCVSQGLSPACAIAAVAIEILWRQGPVISL